MRTRRAVKWMAVGVVLSVAGTACGDDDEEDAVATAAPEVTTAMTDATPATEPATTEPDTTEPDTSVADGDDGAMAVDIPGGSAPMEFCEGFIGIETAMTQMPEDPAEVGAFVTGQITPNVELVEANLPDEIADEVGVMLGALATFSADGDFSAFESPEFAEASAAVYPFLVEGCGLAPLEVEAVDYAFTGVPEQLDAGLYVLQFENASEAEFHEVTFAKLKDGIDLTPAEILALPEEEAMEYVETFAGGTFAPPGESSATVLNLSEGDWMYVCFIPVGATPENEEGTGPPHFMEGMVGTLTVA